MLYRDLYMVGQIEEWGFHLACKFCQMELIMYSFMQIRSPNTQFLCYMKPHTMIFVFCVLCFWSIKAILSSFIWHQICQNTWSNDENMMIFPSSSSWSLPSTIGLTLRVVVYNQNRPSLGLGNPNVRKAWPNKVTIHTHIVGNENRIHFCWFDIWRFWDWIFPPILLIFKKPTVSCTLQ